MHPSYNATEHRRVHGSSVMIFRFLSFEGNRKETILIDWRIMAGTLDVVHCLSIYLVVGFRFDVACSIILGQFYKGDSVLSIQRTGS